VLGELRVHRRFLPRGRPASTLRGLLFAFLLAGATAACSTPQPPVLTPTVARVLGLSPLGLDLDVTLDVRNPNDFTLAARKVEGTLFLGAGQRLGTGRSTPNQGIPARGSASVTSRIRIAWTDAAALSKFLSQASVPWRFEGSSTLGSEHFQIDLPFEVNGQVTREQLLQAGLRGLFESGP
jgi:hypothetical protein